MRRTQLHRVSQSFDAGAATPAGLLNSPTLVFEKFHGYDDFTAFKTTQRDQWLRAVARGVQTSVSATYRAWHTEFAQASQDAHAEILLTARTDSRLVIGWASNPALETGLTLNRLYGFPYLPGSAVKGLVHGVAEFDLLDGADPVPTFSEAALAAPPNDLIAALDRCSLVRAVFGSLHVRRPEESDLPQMPLERLEAWKDALTAREDRTPEWDSVLAQLQVLCGAQNLGGVAIFLDAVPGAQSLLNESALQVDVLTPHYSRYYANVGTATPTINPEDSKRAGDVNPVRFLTVRPGLQFEFRIRVRMPRALADESGTEQARALGGHDHDAVRNLLQDWLVRGLQDHGIGTKTTAGYGYFAPPAIPRQAIVPPDDPIAYAAEFLPAKLQMGSLAERVDRAMTTLTKTQQAAVRLRLREIYPEAVAVWRKQKDKPAAQKRVAWLDQMTTTSPDGSGDKP